MDDDLFQEIRSYSKEVKLKFSTQTKRGFFFRASDFITYQHGIRTMKLQLRKELERVEEEYKDKSIFARNQARVPFARSLAELEQQGRELTTLSHGESFLEFFKSRFTVPGIYIIDEPETPLSYQNQYALLVLIKEMVRKGAQFIIATHSPIIQAIDDSEIIDLDNNLEVIDFDHLDSVSFIKDFLNNKERYIHYLNKEE
jgi:predicted ATPase